MPHGFINSIVNKGYSSETVRSYEKVVTQFFAYLNKANNGYKEPYQISSSDIKNYLEAQKDREKSISTINKELAILKTLFNYLWEKDKVPIDPAVKIKRFKTDERPSMDITYDQILDIQKRVMRNSEYTILRRAIFLLAVKGLKTAEFRFKKDDIIDSSDTNSIEIILKNRKILLEGNEAGCFLEYYYESLLNGSDFVFTTRARGEEVGGPIQVMSILNHLRAISHDYLPSKSQPLTLISIRRAMAYHFYKKKYPIQQIAKELGIEESSASNYLKQLTEEILNEKSS